ncbi:MAG TPA: hypothetical protein VN034_01700 [Sphingopyxis sp.]|nr:hypothetical protein [Sphingopyxis sp.]
MTKIRFLLTPLAAIAVVTVPVFAAPPKESGPWDLMLVTPKSQAIAVAGITRDKCEEGLRLAVRDGHKAYCARYIDNLKAASPEEQRYSAFLYPVTTPTECLLAKRSLGQVECVYR